MALVILVGASWAAQSHRAEAGSPSQPRAALVYVTSGANFPDALGAVPVAAVAGAPVILVPANPPIPLAIETELLRLDPRRVVVVGGSAAVSTAMEDSLKALLPSAVFERVAGANRYETNANLSAATFPLEGWASIPAVAFTADEPDVDDAHISFSASNNSDGTVKAPIQLPHGAEIVEFKVRGHNSADLGGVTIHLWQVGDIGATTVATLTIPTGSGQVTVSTTGIASTVAIVDNENYSYVVVASGVSGNRSIARAMVRYQIGASQG